jgi:hypothetical protein
VTSAELLSIVDMRREAVRSFITWAGNREASNESMYLANRRDIGDARRVADSYPEPWWGVIVFTCFGSVTSAGLVRGVLPDPVDGTKVDALLAEVRFIRPTVGHHRIQQGLTGARRALVAACAHGDFLHDVLNARGRTFDDRYQDLRQAGMASWGRTTCFDLLLRAGAIGIGGEHYEPEMAYLAGSTGPRAGFETVWGWQVRGDTAPRCEELLQAWNRYWLEVAGRVGASWAGRPYGPGDLENALCIYQERRSRPPA